MTKNKRFEIKEFSYDGFLKRKIYDNLEGKKYDCTFKNQDLLCDLLNQQNDEIEQLKGELQKIYDIATANKVIDILETIYDDLLYGTSDKSNFERKIVLKCIEKIDNFRDDLE